MKWRKSQFSFYRENILERDAVHFQAKAWKLTLVGLYTHSKQSARMISK